MARKILLLCVSFLGVFSNNLVKPLKIMPQISKLNLPENSKVPLTCSLISGLHVNFEWMQNGIKLSNNSDFSIENFLTYSMLTIKKLKQEHTGAFECKVTNSLGEFDTSITQINVQGKNLNLKSISVCGAIIAI